MESEKIKHDVFISYSTEDQKTVEGLSAYLEQNGIRCFVAYRDIPKGVDWAEAIAEAIENCRMMVVVFSERFNRSKQVDREISMCIEEGKSILTFKIQNTVFTGTKKYYLQNLNWIDAFPNPEKHFGKLCENIMKLMPESNIEKSQTGIIKNFQTEQAQKSDKNDFIKSKNKFPKYLLFIIGGILLLALLYFFIFKNKNFIQKTENISNPVTDTIFVKKLSSVGTFDEIKNKIVPHSKKAKNSTFITVEKAEKPIAPVAIRYEKSDVIKCESGEQFEVEAGDVFEGIIKAGKAVKGKIIGEDGQVKHLIIPKRNF